MTNETIHPLKTTIGKVAVLLLGMATLVLVFQIIRHLAHLAG
jgi:hypothetical protein